MGGGFKILLKLHLWWLFLQSILTYGAKINDKKFERYYENILNCADINFFLAKIQISELCFLTVSFLLWPNPEEIIGNAQKAALKHFVRSSNLLWKTTRNRHLPAPLNWSIFCFLYSRNSTRRLSSDYFIPTIDFKNKDFNYYLLDICMSSN